MICDLQKASLWKRLSAYIFDMILIAITAVGLVFLMSLLFGYDAYNEKLSVVYEKYEIEYGVKFSEYTSLDETQMKVYLEMEKAVSNDSDANYLVGVIFNLTILMLVFGILISYLIFEFLIPLLLKNGQTLGKKIFGIGVMRKDGIRINSILLFVRTVLGKYTLETMLPIMVAIMFYFGVIGPIGVFLVLALFLSQFVMIAATRNNIAIHDALSQTVTVDISSQMIFDTPEAMLEYKKKLHANEVEKASYR